jgi:hypothetical protein
MSLSENTLRCKNAYSLIPSPSTSVNKSPANTEIVTSKNSPSYIKQAWSQGTYCPLISGYRRAEVQYLCVPGREDHIIRVQETSTCVYLIGIGSGRICKDATFRPRSDEVILECSGDGYADELFSVQELYRRFVKVGEKEERVEVPAAAKTKATFKAFKVTSDEMMKQLMDGDGGELLKKLMGGDEETLNSLLAEEGGEVMKKFMESKAELDRLTKQRGATEEGNMEIAGKIQELLMGSGEIDAEFEEDINDIFQRMKNGGE